MSWSLVAGTPVGLNSTDDDNHVVRLQKAADRSGGPVTMLAGTDGQRKICPMALQQVGLPQRNGEEYD